MTVQKRLFSPNSAQKLIWLLVALSLVRGVLYASLTIPWWQGHDEEYHFAQVKVLIDEWRSAPAEHPPAWSKEMMATFNAFPQGRWSLGPEMPSDPSYVPERFTTLIRPSWSYYLYVWPGLLLVGQEILTQLFVLRLVSVLLTVGTVILAFLCARRVFPDSRLAQFSVAWLVLFIPSFLVTGSTVSDANLAIFLSTGVFYLVVTEIEQGSIGWRWLAALVLTLIAFQTKATTYFLVVVWAALVLLYSWRAGKKYRLYAGILLAALAVLLAFVSPRTVSFLWYHLRLGITLEGLAYVFSPAYFWYTFSFFWIMLGWSVYPLDKMWYILLLLFTIAVLIGLAGYGWRHVKKNGWTLGVEQKLLLLCLLFAGVSIFGLLFRGVVRYDEFEGRSGRYVLPVIVPLAILMVGGWRALLPASWRDAGYLVLAGAFFLFDTMVWVMYFIPWYYPFWP